MTRALPGDRPHGGPFPGEHMAWRGGFLVEHDSAGEPVGTAVLFQPFAEEQKAARRALVELARALAAGGFRVVRPDAFGCGDSPGSHGEATWERWLSESALAAEVCIGLRLGAALAWQAADRGALVLIEPVVNGAAYIRQCRQRSAVRAALTEGDGPERAAAAGEFPAFDFDGFGISGDLHRGISSLDLLAAPLPPVEKMLILQVSGSSRIKKPYEDLAGRAREAGIEVAVENVAVEPFWSSVGIVDTAPVREAVLRFLGLATPAPPLVVQEPAAGRASIAAGVTARMMPFKVSGAPLACVLYEPSTPPERLVVLLHGWSGYRIGPGRLLTDAARELAAAGHAALSFDFRGRGDSAGEVPATTLQSMIDDAVAILPAALEATGAASATLLGLCSGGEVALGAALSDRRIDSLALWSAPIFGGELTLERRARRGQKAAAGYLLKVFRVETWQKLLSGRLNWKLIGRALGGGRSTETVADSKPDPAAQMSKFREFAGRLLLIYGGGDPEAPPAIEFYRPILEAGNIEHRFVEIAGANHNFYALEWKREVISQTLAWLAEGGSG